MWLSDMFKGLPSITQECATQFAAPPGATEAVRQSLLTGQNGCTSGRSEQAQVAMQAIATGLVIGALVGHYLWKRG